MSNAPHSHHSDDAIADDQAPTDGVTDEVRADSAPTGGASGTDAVRADTSYSPASETETARKQEDPVPAGIDDDIDRSDIRAVPGTGGPDDAGDVDVDPADLNMPGSDTDEGAEDDLVADNAAEAGTVASVDPAAPPA